MGCVIRNDRIARCWIRQQVGWKRANTNTFRSNSKNDRPLLTSRFYDEDLLFRRSRGRDDVQLGEELSNAPSFVAIGQVQAEL